MRRLQGQLLLDWSSREGATVAARRVSSSSIRAAVRAPPRLDPRNPTPSQAASLITSRSPAETWKAGLELGTTYYGHRAFRASPAQKMARSAVPRPEGRPMTLRDMAREARHAVLARPSSA